MRISILAGVFAVGLSVSSTAHPALPFANMSEARNVIPEALQSLSQTPNSELLRKLFHQCQCIPENRSAPTWADDRDFKLISALSLLSVIDALQDPKFDPKKTGAFVDAPVPPNSGIMSGEDPADVKDPVLRAQYIAIIKENTAKIVYANLQNDLIRIRREGIGYASWYIKTRYSPAERNDRLKMIIQKQFGADSKSADIVSGLMNATYGSEVRLPQTSTVRRQD